MENRRIDKRNILWAPWRAEYLSSDYENCECIFCEKSAEDSDKKNLVIYRGEKVFALLNLYPYNNGHIMVAPYEHCGDFSELADDAAFEILKVVSFYMKRIKKTMACHGFNMGMNIGDVAGAGCPGHVHMHLVPRWNGDTNFMPVLSGDKVVSEALESVYKKLLVERID